MSQITTTEEVQEASPMFTQEEMQKNISARVNAEKERAAQLLDQKEQEKQALREELEKMKMSAPQAQEAAPAYAQQPPMADQQAPTQQAPMTMEQLQEMLAQNKAQEAEQQKNKSAVEKIQEAANQDSEFKDLAFGGKGYTLPDDHVLEMVKNMGDDALPVIKQALSSPEMSHELSSHKDVASLISWAYKKNRAISKANDEQAGESFQPKPSVYSAGTSPSNDDEDDIASLVSGSNV